MGCGGSKLDDLDAVSLCRYRSQRLADAIHHRDVLADAHLAYVQCLRSTGLSLHRFFLVTDPIAPSYPVLTLPDRRKGAPIFSATTATGHLHSRSSSGSHLRFHSDSGDSDSDGPLHSEHASPLHHVEEIDRKTTTETYFNFARKGPPASSVAFEQRPEVVPVQVTAFGGDPSSSASYGNYNYYANPYASQNPNYIDSGGGGGGYNAYAYSYPPASGGGAFFGSSAPPVVPAPASPSRPPPAPPSPPKASNWDFLNPFESYQSFQQTYTPSRSSRDLREEEGIPDLEEEEEVVKEAYDDRKLADSVSDNGGGDVHFSGKAAVPEEDRRRSIGEELPYPDGEVHLTEKNVVIDEVLQGRPEEKSRKAVLGSRTVPDAMCEITTEFDRASACCEEVGKMLEVGKLLYHRRKREVISSKMYAITPSLSTAATSQTSTSKTGEHSDSASSSYLEFDEERGMKTGNLSSTLQKLSIWENKLKEEVRAEEELRLRHDRKCNHLKRLDEKGAEIQKIDSTRALVLKLSTKIRIAIQVVDSISNRINKLRDEELWPQLHELIEGLVRMWQVMTECHRSQCQAVMEANNLDAVASAFAGKFSDAHMDATLQLGLELLNWIEIFSSWIGAQKCYVKSLNDWLLKYLLDEPEETADGIAPFSPGRLGAPSVFVICNHWSLAIDRISELEVVEAMQSFAASILQVWQQHYGERRNRMLANRNTDKGLKALEREDQMIHKAVDAINKRRAQVASLNGLPYAGEVIHVKHAGEAASLHVALQKMFEAMEKFSESSVKAYKELYARCREEKEARENARAS